MSKVYVEVNAKFDTDGNIIPSTVFWSDGREYAIDRIRHKCKAASLKAGGAGIRYEIDVLGKTTYLFLEGNRWFVEGKH